MKNVILIIGAIFCLGGCNFVDESRDIEEITEEFSMANDCNVTFQNGISDKEKELILKFHCSISKNNLLPGKILLDIFEKIRQKGIEIDTYQVIDDKGNIYIDLKTKEILTILKRKEIFEKDLSILIHSKDYKELYDKFTAQIKMLYSYEELTKNYDKILIKEYPDFDGFSLSEFDNKKYIIFRRSNKEKNVAISLRLNELSDTIYGISME